VRDKCHDFAADCQPSLECILRVADTSGGRLDSAFEPVSLRIHDREAIQLPNLTEVERADERPHYTR
jgi:hypothetical protein